MSTSQKCFMSATLILVVKNIYYCVLLIIPHKKLPPVSKCSQNDRVFHFTYLVSVLHCWALRTFWINKYVPKIKYWNLFIYLLICSYPTISVKTYCFLCIICIYIIPLYPIYPLYCHTPISKPWEGLTALRKQTNKQKILIIAHLRHPQHVNSQFGCDSLFKLYCYRMWLLLDIHNQNCALKSKILFYL